MSELVAPYGGRLTSLMLTPDAADAEKARAARFVSVDLDARRLADLELLLSGAFSPLSGFMGQRDYETVLDEMRLATGVLWPVPVTLEVADSLAGKLAVGDEVALRDPEGVLVATLRIDSMWTASSARETRALLGAERGVVPSLGGVFRDTEAVHIGGPVRGVEAPPRYAFQTLRAGPAAVRERLAGLGWQAVLGCVANVPLDRVRCAQLVAALADPVDGALVIATTLARANDDAGFYARVRTLRAACAAMTSAAAQATLVEYAPRGAPVRDAVAVAIVARNYGCSHYLEGAQSGSADAVPPACHDAVQRLIHDGLRAHAGDIGLELRPPRRIGHRAGAAGLEVVGTSEPEIKPLAGAELRRRLDAGEDLAPWFTDPGVADELATIYPPRARQGFTVFFTGLSGSGKSTIANAVLVKLLEAGRRPVTLLDGDRVRKSLSSELGFSREHRNLNIARIGYVASEIVKHRGIAICAPIAPYTALRAEVRAMVEAVGGFIEVHVATPIEVCEERDRKGLYAKARAGLIKEFTGIDDPYEDPEHPEVRIDTAHTTPEQAANAVVAALRQLGYLR